MSSWSNVLEFVSVNNKIDWIWTSVIGLNFCMYINLKKTTQDLKFCEYKVFRKRWRFWETQTYTSSANNHILIQINILGCLYILLLTCRRSLFHDSQERPKKVKLCKFKLKLCLSVSVFQWKYIWSNHMKTHISQSCI